jgi:hypothetical protein
MPYMESKLIEDLTIYKLKCLIPLFLPCVIAAYISFQPVTSFLFAWLASIFLFVYSINGPVKHICTDLELSFQVMRPMILIQLIFVGLMSGTSIFYFMDHLGYHFWKDQGLKNFEPNEETYRLAMCQRLYLLAHASLLFGMILKLRKRTEQPYIFSQDPAQFLIPILLIVLIAMFVFRMIPGLNQVAVMFLPIPKIIATVVLLEGFLRKRPLWIVLGSVVFCHSLYQAATTGYKEAMFVHVIILGFVFFPYYKRLIVIVLLPVVLTLLYILPTWNNTIRSDEWLVMGTTEEAKAKAIELVFENDNEKILQDDSWQFLVNRFTEINMFSKYVAYVPDSHPFYGTEILEQAFEALIPRYLWPSKPNTELKSMERVYEAEIVSRNSDVSAKTRPVVDGYLSAGYAGVFLVMVIYGITCQGMANLAETLFGGYQIGCVIVFNGLFQQLWRGNNLEFILNNILYGYLVMLLIFYALRWAGVLTKHH